MPRPAIAAAIAALPPDALEGYEGAVELIGLMPWKGNPYVESKPDGNMRTIIFGPWGNGLVTYLVLEEEQQVHILKVFWAG